MINVPLKTYLQRLREELGKTTKDLGPSSIRSGHIRDAQSARPAQSHAPPAGMMRNRASIDDIRKRDSLSGRLSSNCRRLRRGRLRARAAESAGRPAPSPSSGRGPKRPRRWGRAADAWSRDGRARAAAAPVSREHDAVVVTGGPSPRGPGPRLCAARGTCVSKRISERGRPPREWAAR